MTMSASRAAAAGVSATVPRPSASARERVRFHSTTSKPAADSRVAMAEPIFPVPRIATLRIWIGCLFFIVSAPRHRFGCRAADGNVTSQYQLDLGDVLRRQLQVGGRGRLSDLLRAAGPDDRDIH